MKSSERKITVELMTKRGRLEMLTRKGRGTILVRAHNMAHHVVVRETVASALESRNILTKGCGLPIIAAMVNDLPCAPTVAMLEESLRAIELETATPQQGELPL